MKRILTFVILCAMLLLHISACSSNKAADSGAVETEAIGTIESGDNQDSSCEENEHSDGKNEPEGRGGELKPAVFLSGEYEGKYNPADIRGSYTLGSISRYFDISLSVLAEAFHIPVDEAEMVQNKHYKYIFDGLSGSGKNIGNGSMIVFVSMYTGMPFDIHEPEYLLEPAAKILKELGTLSEEELEYLEKYIVTVEEAAPIPFNQISFHEDDDDEYKIYGRTTFGDLLQMGIPEEEISRIIGVPVPDSRISVKDYCVEKGLPFSDYVRQALYEVLYSLIY